MRRRALTEADRAVWASYAQMVVALPGVDVPEPRSAPPIDPVPAPVLAVPVMKAARAPVAALVVGTSPGGVDASTWSRFRGGKLRAERTLDLHGRTAQVAHAALDGFLLRAAAEGVRCVEVITGRGQGEGGVIKREFPHWMNAPHLRALILGAAHPHALNPGSVRLLLRRARR